MKPLPFNKAPEEQEDPAEEHRGTPKLSSKEAKPLSSEAMVVVVVAVTTVDVVVVVVVVVVATITGA
jgi:cytoskeletal protein RodZ